jgi:hypothetical protein
MDANAQSMINLLISKDLYDEDQDEKDRREEPSSYAMTRAIQLLGDLGEITRVPFVKPLPDDEGGLYLAWDCDRANVTVHIFATPEGGFVKSWNDENENEHTLNLSKDYIYFDFMDDSGNTSINCGSDEDISANNVKKYLDVYKELC